MGRWVKFLASLGVTGVCLWWTLRNVDWPGMWASLKAANYTVFIYYGFFLAIIHIARTLRWGNLLSPLEKVPFKPLNEASAIGFMMLIILPFRIGEFARPFLIAQRSKIRRSAAMSSVVLERIIDGIVIAVLLRVLMLFVSGESESITRIKIGANVMFSIFFGGLVFILLAASQHERMLRLIRATVGRVSSGLGEKIVHMTDGFVTAVKQLPDAKNVAQFCAWTALYWFVNGAGMWLVANAFDCSAAGVQVCEPLHITLFQGFVVLCVGIVGIMIPAGPGGAGTFQAFLLLGLSVFVPESVNRSSGVAYVYVIWLVQIIQQIGLGLVLMVMSHASFKDIAGKLSEQQQQAGQGEGA